MTSPSVGVCLLPEVPWREDAARWRDAETAGFSTLWTYDHLSWRSLRDGPWYAAIPLLAAAAGITSSARLGMLVASPNFRHPVPFAKELMTLDEISGGRVDVGLGAGTPAHDAGVLGLDPLSPAERMSRFVDFVDVLDACLTRPATTMSTASFEVVDARNIPGCVQRPRLPFTVAATGRRGLALAARYAQCWVTYGPASGGETPDGWWEGVRHQRDGLIAACEAIDRDPGTVRRMALVSLDLDWAQSSPGAWDDFVARAVDAEFTDLVVHWPRPGDPAIPGPTETTFEHIVSALS